MAQIQIDPYATLRTGPSIIELKNDRAKAREAAEKLVKASQTRNTDLSASEQTQFNQYLDEVKRLTGSINRHEDLERVQPAAALHPAISARAGIFASAVPRQRGSGSSLRDVYNESSAETRERIDALANYVVRGDITALADLRPGNDGASIIPTEIVPTLERDYLAVSPVANVSRLWLTDTGVDAVFPVLNDSESAVQIDSAAATGADDTVTGDTPPTDLTGPTLHAWKISSKPVFVPRETFTDSAIDIVGEVLGALLARIIRFENSRFTSGTGSGQAQGFLTAATAHNVAGSTALDLDICLDMAYSVGTLYRPRGIYMMSDTTAKYLRKVKTGISGDKRQLWADADATAGSPATLHGYPVVINNDMTSVAADGTFTGNPVAFGDFSRFVVRQAERNRPYAYRYSVPARDGAAVILFRRSDSKLLVPAAISKLGVSS